MTCDKWWVLGFYWTRLNQNRKHCSFSVVTSITPWSQYVDPLQLLDAIYIHAWLGEFLRNHRQFPHQTQTKHPENKHQKLTIQDTFSNSEKWQIIGKTVHLYPFHQKTYIQLYWNLIFKICFLSQKARFQNPFEKLLLVFLIFQKQVTWLEFFF